MKVKKQKFDSGDKEYFLRPLLNDDFPALFSGYLEL